MKNEGRQLENFAAICAQALNLAKNFLEHGADCSVWLSFRHHVGYYVKKWGDIVIERSVYSILKGFCAQTSASILSLEPYLQKSGAIPKCTIVKIERVDSGRFLNVLRFLTEEQKQKLERLAEDHLLHFSISAHKRLHEEMEEVWNAMQSSKEIRSEINAFSDDDSISEQAGSSASGK